MTWRHLVRRLAVLSVFLVLAPPGLAAIDAIDAIDAEVSARDVDTDTGLDADLLTLTRSLNLDGLPDGHDAVPGPFDPIATLGRALFFSRHLSGEQDVACVSCHHPLLAGGDKLSLAVGIAAHQPDVVGPGRVVNLEKDSDPKAKTIGGPNVPRNTLSTFNSGFYRHNLMHDGRIFVLGEDASGRPLYRTPESTLRNLPDLNATGDLLSVQARFPVTGFEEMRGFGDFYALTAPEIRDEIAARFVDNADKWLLKFQIAFKKPGVSAEDLITYDHIALALSAYQRSQSFVDTPWARYLSGDNEAVTQQQKEGALLFYRTPEQGGLGCAACHAGDFFTDEKAHVAAFPQLGRGKRADGDDQGLYLITQDKADRYRFRTPTLINVTESGPWGHAGSFESLASLVRYHINPAVGVKRYDFSLAHLSQFANAPDAYPNARALTLRALEQLGSSLLLQSISDDDVDRLVVFLESLTDPCLHSRECLQPWIAGSDDDLDGHLLQPVFKQAGDIRNELPFHVNVASDSPDIISALSTARANISPDASAMEGLVACRHYDAGDRETSRSAFADRTEDYGFDHRHHVPGEMWYGRKYSYVVELAMETGPMVTGDINGDCWPDFLFASHDETSAVVIAYLNRGGKSFDKTTLRLAELPDAIGSLGLADLDGDYRLDLTVGNLFGAREAVVYQRTTDRFEVLQKISMSKVIFGFAFADYSGDGWVDMFAAHWDITARPALAPALMQNKFGYLYPADEIAGTTGADLEQNFHFSPGFADLDRDGDMDLLIASDFGTSEVLENLGDGRYRIATDRDIISDENGMGSAIGDFNNDGWLDWFVSAIYKENDPDFKWGHTGNRMYMATGEGLAFVDKTDEADVRHGAWSWGTCAADFNNDGWLDLFVENGFGYLPDHVRGHVPDYYYKFLPLGLQDFHVEQPRLYINQGDGTFVDQSTDWQLVEKTNSRGVACVDYDRDGDIDLAVSQNSTTPRIYENLYRGETSNNFIGFHLIGDQPNTSAIGATVRLTANGMIQTRQVQMNSNYQSQNPSTLHFGIGGETEVERILVIWPDGIEESLGPIEGSQYYALIHPSLRKPEVAQLMQR